MMNGKIVYIASPFAGEVTKNVEFAKKACRYCMDAGHAPIAAHLLYPQILDDNDPLEREAGLLMGRRILEICDELWVCGEKVSEGMRKEIEMAGRMEIPVMKISKARIENFIRRIQTENECPKMEMT